MTRLKESMSLRVEAMALSIEELPVTRLRRSSWWIEARLRSETFLASRSVVKSLVASSRRRVVWERSCFLFKLMVALVVFDESLIVVVACGMAWVFIGLVIADM